MLYVSWCILYVSYMYLKQRMEYIKIHTEYTTIHVSTPSHMARPVRLWDTPGYNRIHQDTSARAYPHRLHTWDTWGIHAAMMYPIVAGEIHAGYIQDTCWIQRSMCILEESIRHMQDTCAGYMQDTFRIHVQRMYLRAACGIHAKSMLDTACKHVSLGRSEGYVKNTCKIHAGTVFRLYLACIL